MHFGISGVAFSKNPDMPHPKFAVSRYIDIIGYLLPATKYYLCVHGVSKKSNGI
jgi:hypothetical protein